MTQTVSQGMLDDLFVFRYRLAFKLSVAEYENEPWQAIWQARTIWSLEDERAKLEKERAARPQN